MDPVFEDAAEFAILSQNITSDDLRSRFGLGLSRAEIVLGQLESAGVVGKTDEQGLYKSSFSSVEDLESMIGGPLHEEEPLEYEEVDFDYLPEGHDIEVAEQVTKSSDVQYSDSVNAMNGCLGYVGHVLSYTCIILLFILLAPVIILVLLAWWIIAWILGLIFPGKEFFPIKKIYHSVSPWFKRTFGISLEDAAIASILVVAIGAILDGVSNLFSKRN